MMNAGSHLDAMATSSFARRRPHDPIELQAPADIVRKAVDALAIVPTKQRIYPLARKLYNVLIFLAQRQGFESDIFRAPLREITTTAAFTSNDTEIIKNHLRQMNATQVEWQSPTRGEGARWEVSNLIAHAALIDEGNVGSPVIIEWSFPPNIKRQLLDPERFAQISLLFQSNLRSNAAVALFEICSRYVDNPGGKTARNPWAWWRPVLTGIPDADVDTYLQYKYFKRDVLTRAVAEINKVTDLDVELIEHRQGRRIQDLQFGVRRKEQRQLDLAVPPKFDINLIGIAIKAGIPQPAAERLIVQFGDEPFRAALREMTERVHAGRAPVAKPEQYLTAMLRKGGFGKAAGAQVVRAAAGPPKPSREQLEVQFRDSRRQAARELFAELDDADRVGWQQRYEDEVLPQAEDIIRSNYKKSGLATRAAQVMFFEWFARETWGATWNVPSADDLVGLLTEG